MKQRMQIIWIYLFKILFFIIGSKTALSSETFTKELYKNLLIFFGFYFYHVFRVTLLSASYSTLYILT